MSENPKAIGYELFSDMCAVRSILSVISVITEKHDGSICITPKTLYELCEYRREQMDHPNYASYMLGTHEVIAISDLYHLFTSKEKGKSQFPSFPILDKYADYYLNYGALNPTLLWQILRLPNVHVCLEVGNHIAHVQLNEQGKVIAVSDASATVDWPSSLTSNENMGALIFHPRNFDFEGWFRKAKENPTRVEDHVTIFLMRLLVHSITSTTDPAGE